MGKQRHQKLQFIKGLFVVLYVISTSPLSSLADSADTFDIQSATKIEYNDYEFFYDKNNQLDCKGKATFTFQTPPESVHSVIVRFTTRYGRFPFNGTIPYKVTDDVTVGYNDLFYWNTDFKIHFYFKDGSNVMSPIYNMSDFIKTEDLEKLLQQGSVANIEDEPLIVYVKNNNLYIKSTEPINISIFTPEGLQIYHASFHESMPIPLETLPYPFVIVRCFNSKSSITQKIQIL